jgi:hypothetical protein
MCLFETEQLAWTSNCNPWNHAWRSPPESHEAMLGVNWAESVEHPSVLVLMTHSYWALIGFGLEMCFDLYEVKNSYFLTWSLPKSESWNRKREPKLVLVLVHVLTHILRTLHIQKRNSKLLTRKNGEQQIAPTPPQKAAVPSVFKELTLPSGFFM